MAAGPLLSRPVAQAALLAVAGAALGLAWNGARDGGIRLDHPVNAGAGREAAATCAAPAGTIRDVTVAEAEALRGPATAFVDARPAGAFAEGHVEGALHLPSRGDCPDGPTVIEALRRSQVVVVYDADGSCAEARHLADRLAAEGVADVRVMLGGFPSWLDRSLPSESGTCVACADGRDG